MELTLLMLCGVALLAGKCSSDAIIQRCPDGQKYVSKHSDVSLTCGPCNELIVWYVDDNSCEDKKYLGKCTKTTCDENISAAFRLKVNTSYTLDFCSVLDISNFTRNNTNFVCACYRYINRINGYDLQSNDSCKLLITVSPGNPQLQCPQTVLEGSNVSCTCTSDNKGSPPAQYVWDVTDTDTLLLQDVRRELNSMKYTCRQTWDFNGLINKTIVYTLRVVENQKPPSENMKGEIVGGVFAAVVAVAMIGTIVTVYIRRKAAIIPSYTVVNRSQTPVLHYMATSGDIYTVASTTIAGDIYGEYVTLSEMPENTMSERDMGGNHQTSKEIPDKTKKKTTFKPTIKSKLTSGAPRKFSDLSVSGTGYMNVTEVPTDSGLDVYHIVPCAVMSAQPQPDTEENNESVLLEEEYNVLRFQAELTEKEDHGATYRYLEHY